MALLRHCCIWTAGIYVGESDKHVCRMSYWRTRLRNLDGLSVREKFYLEGKLLAFGDDDKAACFFLHNESDELTVRRLSALLPEAGETSRKHSHFLQPQLKTLLE